MLIADNMLILLYLLAPVIVVIATAFTTTAYPVFPPQGFTLQWFQRFLGMPEFTDAIQRSALSPTPVVTARRIAVAKSSSGHTGSAIPARSASGICPIVIGPSGQRSTRRCTV